MVTNDCSHKAWILRLNTWIGYWDEPVKRKGVMLYPSNLDWHRVRHSITNARWEKKTQLGKEYKPVECYYLLEYCLPE